MWPFRKRTRHQDVIDLFGRYIDKETLERMERSPPPLEWRRRLAYVAILVRDDTIEEARGHLGEALGALGEYGGRLETIESCMMLYIFGGHPESEEAAAAHWRSIGTYAGAVADKLGPNAKVVYGQADSLDGLLGTGRSFWLGATLPGYAKVIAALVNLEFGSSLGIDLP